MATAIGLQYSLIELSFMITNSLTASKKMSRLEGIPQSLNLPSGPAGTLVLISMSAFMGFNLWRLLSNSSYSNRIHA